MITATHLAESESGVAGISNYADRLMGVWELVTYTDEESGRDDALPFGPDPQGVLIYTQDGFVSAQLMRPNRPAFHSSDWHQGTPEEYQASGSGYIAYCGTFEVNEENAMVTHIPSVSLLPNLIGERQCRTIDFEGDRLVLRAAGAPVEGGRFVTSRLEWKRITPNVVPST